MKKIIQKIVALCCFALLTGCVHPPKEQIVLPKPGSLRIVNYNINWMQDRGFKVTDPVSSLRAIHLIRPDIIVIEEATPQWEKLIEKYLAHDFRYRQYLHYPNGCGFAVLSKYPVRGTAIIRSVIGWYPALVTRVKTPYGVIQVLAVHLLPPMTPHDTPGFPNYPFMKTEFLQRKEIRYFYHFLDLRYNTVIIGDFNVGDDGLAPEFLRAQGMVDALAARKGYSWHWPLLHGWLVLSNRAEHIFYDPKRLSLIRTQIVYDGDSDHYPIVADFH